jgi:hypothetical protein
MPRMKKHLMTEEEKARLYRICYDGKRRTAMDVEDFYFAVEMWHMDPEGYDVVQKKAVKDSVADQPDGTGVSR